MPHGKLAHQPACVARTTSKPPPSQSSYKMVEALQPEDRRKATQAATSRTKRDTPRANLPEAFQPPRCVHAIKSHARFQTLALLLSGGWTRGINCLSTSAIGGDGLPYSREARRPHQLLRCSQALAETF